MTREALKKHALAFVPAGLCIATAACVGITTPALAVGAAGVGEVKNIVLVHGADTDGSPWHGVYNILRKGCRNPRILRASSFARST